MGQVTILSPLDQIKGQDFKKKSPRNFLTIAGDPDPILDSSSHIISTGQGKIIIRAVRLELINQDYIHSFTLGFSIVNYDIVLLSLGGSTRISLRSV
jgi:hypothetical protein